MTELGKRQNRNAGGAYRIHSRYGRAVTKLLIDKGVISEAEFKEQLLKERATYQKLLQQPKPH